MVTGEATPRTPPRPADNPPADADGSPERADADGSPPGDGHFMPTAALPRPEHRTSVISDVLEAVKRDADSEPTFPSFERLEGFPEIPGYQLLGVLGRGGMGIVYKALQVELGRVVAIKMILSTALADPVAQQRFLAEAKAIAQLHHPGIVSIYEVGKHQSSPYFVLEYVPDGSLSMRVRGQPQPPREAATLVEQIARAMQAAHDKGIIHRDLKPGNILLTFSRDAQRSDPTRDPPLLSESRLTGAVPKVTDFGLAKDVGDTATRTRSGEIVGTPNYMAPEQIDNRAPGIGPQTDQYAVGAILYELLAGRPPFQGVTPMETLMQVLKQPVVGPSRLNPQVPTDLETICLKALSKEPHRRYASCAELADDLGRFLRNEPIRARPTPLYERAWRWCERNPSIALLSMCLMTLLVSGLILVSYLYWKAETNLADARRKFELARQAVDKLTTAGDELQDASDIPRVRREMLQEGLLFYQEFLKERSHDPLLRHQAGNACRRVGDLQYQLGRLKESEAALFMATQMLGELAVEQPGDLQLRYDLAMAFKAYGITVANLRRFADSEGAYRQAKTYAEQLVEQAPTNAEFRRLLADSLNNLGLRLIARGRLDEAEAAHRRSMEIREALLAEQPYVLDKQLALASIQSNYAYLMVQQGRLPEAEDYNLRALAVRRRAVAEHPNISSYRKMLADTLLALAELNTLRQNFPAAASMYHEGLKLRAELATDFPTVANHRRDHGNSVHDYGVMLLAAGKDSEALVQFRLAAVLWSRFAADFPQRPEYTRRARLMQAYLAAAEGRTSSLLTQVDEALARTGNDGEPAYFAARILALASGKERDQAQAKLFAQRAIEALRQSWTLDYFRARWQPRELETLPEFATLRGTPEFQALLSSLKSP